MGNTCFELHLKPITSQPRKEIPSEKHRRKPIKPDYTSTVTESRDFSSRLFFARIALVGNGSQDGYLAKSLFFTSSFALGAVNIRYSGTFQLVGSK